MSDHRPVLVGMNNPLSPHPRHALYPSPPGCTGHRIYEMLRAARPGTTEEEYLAGFDRRNLIGGRTWPTGRGAAQHRRMAADALRATLAGSDRHVVLLGKDVQRAFGVIMEPLSFERSRHGYWVHCVPHPSGLCRWYNEGDNARRVGELLARLLPLSVPPA
jgi:hypothetical protein